MALPTVAATQASTRTMGYRFERADGSAAQCKARPAPTEAHTTDFLVAHSTLAAEFLPPRRERGVCPRPTLAPLVDVLLACVLIVAWPLKQLKHFLMKAAHREPRAQRLREDLDAAHRLLRSQQVGPELAQDHAAMRSSTDELRAQGAQMRDELKQLEPHVRKAQKILQEAHYAAERGVQITAQLERKKSELSRHQIRVQEAHAAYERLVARIERVQHDAPALVRELEEQEAELRALRGEKQALATRRNDVERACVEPSDAVAKSDLLPQAKRRSMPHLSRDFWQGYNAGLRQERAS